jgi:hypothetical protein
MNGANLSKGPIAERERKGIEVGDYICAGIRIAIQADCARILIYAAADIQDGKVGQTIAFRRLPLTYRFVCVENRRAQFRKSILGRLRFRLSVGGHNSGKRS